jgi:hypothetical protein
MKIFCTASSDLYITDKIINEKIRATDANTGKAGTLDLFKLYDETELTGSDSQNEISRLLVKFDLTKPRDLIRKNLDVRHKSFSAKIKLFDIRSGHATPSRFSVVAYPLSRSFEEGIGRNISEFSDLGVSNFFTSSIQNGSPVAWAVSGANGKGGLNTGNIDLIESGTIGGEVFQFGSSQFFESGNEDLSIDVTTAISGTLMGHVPDLGFRISFSGSDESDKKTRFVKRFASRHSSNPLLRPRLEISYDDSVKDDRSEFYFDNFGTVFLRNSKGSSFSNLKAGGSQITGDDALKIKIRKGKYSKVFNASQVKVGSYDSLATGIYSASFSVSSEDSTEYERGKSLASLIAKEKEVVFEEFWFSNDGTKGFYTGSLTLKSEKAQASVFGDDIEVFSTNCRSSYFTTDSDKIRLFGLNRTEDQNKPRKKSIKRRSEVFEKVYYRVIDADSLDVIFDFGESDNSTRVSTDDEGMYFNFHMDVLHPGRSYVFEYLIIQGNHRRISRDSKSRFTVR